MLPARPESTWGLEERKKHPRGAEAGTVSWAPRDVWRNAARTRSVSHEPPGRKKTRFTKNARLVSCHAPGQKKKNNGVEEFYQGTSLASQKVPAMPRARDFRDN